MNKAIAYFDGGARGNHDTAIANESAYAYIIYVVNGSAGETTEIEKYAEDALSSTNNEAEYAGLVAVLAAARRLGFKDLEVRGDSKLVVEQFNGKWKVKAENLKPYLEKARDLSLFFDNLVVVHVPREMNPADQYYNRFLDRGL